MNKKLAETYSRYALEVLAEEQHFENMKNLKSKSASFGPTIISVGLLPTVLLFSKDRIDNKINEFIWRILRKDNSLGFAEDATLLVYVQQQGDYRLKRSRILLASTCLKNALRTYPD